MAKKQTPKRDPEKELEDIRDDCIAIFLNSGMTYEQVHANGGPTHTTITRWLYKETRFPQFATIRSFLKACGADLVAVSANRADKIKGNLSDRERLGVDVEFVGKPTMPVRRGREARKAARKEARRGNLKR
jgi:hypothetical protein